MKGLFILFFAALLVGCQTNPPQGVSILDKPLAFSVSKKSDGLASNHLYFPSDDSSATNYPAVILMHSCAGITYKNESDLRRWKSVLLNAGYAVLVMDHLSSRGVSRNCGRYRLINRSRLVKDVYQATDFLSSSQQIDKTKIFTLGFSLGAMTGASAASRSQYSYHGMSKPRPRAVAGLYGGCVYGRGFYWLHTDTDLPILWLMGGKDKEAPAEDCQGVFKQLRNKDLVATHLYPEATHCWDCKDLDGFSKRAGNGEYVIYQYNSAYTKDSEKRVLDYFNSFQ